MSAADSISLATLYQDVLVKRVTLVSMAGELSSTEAKQLGFEMALCVCDADGVQSKAEQAFLAEALTALGLDKAASQQFIEAAESLAAASLGEAEKQATVIGVVSPVTTAEAAVSKLPSASYSSAQANAGGVPAVDEQALDQTILNAAITNGVLELLPETLSTLAIIPLQMRVVYRIGQAYGYGLDRGHIKDFLATAGVGLTSQYLEEAGRKLLGGLLEKVGGGPLRDVCNQAVRSSMSFSATDCALGHVAGRYYAGGRTLSAQMLKDSYTSIAEGARGIQGKYLPALREEARTLDAAKVMAMVWGR